MHTLVIEANLSMGHETDFLSSDFLSSLNFGQVTDRIRCIWAHRAYAQVGSKIVGDKQIPGSCYHTNKFTSQSSFIGDTEKYDQSTYIRISWQSRFWAYLLKVIQRAKWSKTNIPYICTCPAGQVDIPGPGHKYIFYRFILRISIIFFVISSPAVSP